MAKPTNHGNPWTPADIALLNRLAKQNKPTTAIAKQLKRTEASVRSKGQELGISFKSPN